MKILKLVIACTLLTGCATDRTATVTQEDPTPATSTVPGPEVIAAQTCVDDAWLLTHYDVARLASGSSPSPGTGYPVECCADGVLGDDDTWRCELDWPSSDLVGCSLWREYHDTLAAAHPEGARSERVKANLATLQAWFTGKHNCMTEPPG